MKKHSIFLRASGVLLALTLATSCFVGGTFAKYTTRKSATDTARVAKWGVELEVTGNAFSVYDSKDANDADLPKPEVDIDDDGINEQVSVISSTTEKVVAPGTSGTFGGVKITGEPEVAVNITSEADVELTGWTDGDDNYYCPLVFKIERHYNYWSGSGNPQPKSEVIQEISGLDYPDVYAFQNAVNKAITDNINRKNIQAGTDLSKIYLTDKQTTGYSASSIKLSWEWPFENEEGDEYDQTDDKDTELGNKADANDAPEIDITVTTTVTQID